MTSGLENLCGPGKPLSQEPPDQTEFNGLVRSGRVRLQDAQNAQNALESRFDLAYNATDTLGLGPEVWRVLDKCHNQRNLAEYEGMLDVDESLVNGLLEATTSVLQAIEERYPS